MDKKEAIDYLKERLGEIPTLTKLNYNNNEYPLWRHQIEDVLEAVFGNESNEYRKFTKAGHRAHMRGLPMAESIYQEDYIENLRSIEIEILSIIKKYETLGFGVEPATVAGLPPKAFIAHGGESPALNKLKKFLEALGVEPLVVEDQASEGRSVGENVDWYSEQADCAIILAARGDIDGKTGQFIPRGNVLMEIGKLQLLFKGKIIYLLQSNSKFPTNVSEKVWARFSPQSMDNSFIKIARELKAFGILRAMKPPNPLI